VNSSAHAWPSLIASLAGRRVLVVGDVMIDDYISGDARRVCPEAPVPVVEANGRWSTPGGAANAAANIAALGGQAILGGVVGDDHAAKQLVGAAVAAGVGTAGIVTDASRPTTIKTRVLDRGQQVIRIDTEVKSPLSESVNDQLVSWAERTVSEVDSILISDYGKGVVDGLAKRLIDAARRNAKPVIVDPKGKDSERYRGATVIKPNQGELAELLGCEIRASDHLFEVGQQFADRLAGSIILVTLGADGAAVFRSGQGVLRVPAFSARRVFDVTGAGDTVAASLALALGSGLAIEIAAQIANAAAGIVVGKIGTSTARPSELLEILHGQED
jgi:rfaE bifunctional protein kinase chain/domain